jgi:hypothetical protein
MEPPNGATMGVGEGGEEARAGYEVARWGVDFESSWNEGGGVDSSNSRLEDDLQHGIRAWEEGDNLQRTVAAYLARNPHQRTRFIYDVSGVFVPNSELHLQDMQDNISDLSPSVISTGRRPNDDGRLGLSTIEESPTSSSISRSSMISHQISEPDIPHAAAAPAQDMGSYLKNATPNMKNLIEFVRMCNTTGLNDEVINTLKMTLIHDNGTTRSEDLATFCLTKLLVLACQSDDNKRMMIVDDIDGAGAISAFDAIKEAAHIHRRSAEIQRMVCDVLWSLSIKYQKHIAQNGGCTVILDTMKIHAEVDSLQVKALGALKVISFDVVGKSTLLSQGGMLIVSGVMRTHAYNPKIQSDGCVILGNLAVDEASQSAIPVSENEVDAIINGMIAHENCLEVQEAA